GVYVGVCERDDVNLRPRTCFSRSLFNDYTCPGLPVVARIWQVALERDDHQVTLPGSLLRMIPGPRCGIVPVSRTRYTVVPVKSTLLSVAVPSSWLVILALSCSGSLAVPLSALE